MKRVDTWELIAAVAMHCAGQKTVRGATYRISAFSVADAMSKLSRIARTLRGRYETACNEDIAPLLCHACGGPKSKRRHVPSECWEAKTESLEARAAAIGAPLSLVVTTQRDPRGASVKIWADHDDGRMLGVM